MVGLQATPSNSTESAADRRALDSTLYAEMVARTYHITTYGCQMNEHDTERIAGLLEADGCTPATTLEDADVIVLNTCCIRENADNKLYAKLGDLKAVKEERPDVQIAVAGCLAQKDRDLIRERAGHVDVVFGTHNVHRAIDLLDEARENGPIMEILEETARSDAQAFPSALPARRETDYAAWVTIQIGCDNSCAFCIVPAVRGPEISRPFAALVSEVEQLATVGVTEVTLLGQNVNSYGRDLTLADRKAGGSGSIRPLFAELLEAVGEIEGIERIRYTSPHPKDLRPETIDAMANVASVCEHLHLPLQSGSDRVLAAMHRGYRAERYLERLAEARIAISDLSVTTDIIVGFPGETNEEFERTLEVAAEANFDGAYTFIYSPRPGTEAAEQVDSFIAHSEAVERYERLRQVVGRSSRIKHSERIGRTESVVVEGLSRRDDQQFTGRTRQNKIVHFPATEPLRVGTYALVEIVGAAGYYLHGELSEVTARPRHKARIPVVAV